MNIPTALNNIIAVTPVPLAIVDTDLKLSRGICAMDFTISPGK